MKMKSAPAVHTRPKVPATELAWRLQQALRRAGFAPNSVTVAVVPDETHGWRAVTAAKMIARYPSLGDVIDKAQKQLQAAFDIDAD